MLELTGYGLSGNAYSFRADSHTVVLVLHVGTRDRDTDAAP